jgi:hypothetical protein
MNLNKKILREERLLKNGKKEMLTFEFNWNDVKGTRFFLNSHGREGWYVLVWISDDEETLLGSWLIEPIYEI